MMSTDSPQITLEQAKQLVLLLENNEQDQADELLLQITTQMQSELFEEVGKLTRQLHDSLNNFQLDSKLIDLTQDALPDAKERLNYVIKMTENAANKTMDAIEVGLPLADKLTSDLDNIKPSWERLMNRDLKLGEFKSLCHGLDAFIINTKGNTQKLQGLLTEVLMAQDFQDLTGQVIRRVIELLREVEESLIHMLKVFGSPLDGKLPESEAIEEKDIELSLQVEKELDQVAEGPIIDALERDDVVSDQDDVDDLLSSLGF
ncbi:protein phosphatase CheZ [Pseudoalteromonas sp. NBT06-2]|uniref:protein phosphatase CheZ n=1 Tax=Pseudoalteromonas sp. NBT06-2 TaxID=2025950 RepID=UPI0020763EB0|nr:protein phosphatase CheZ [Pseudoalteromonas sp. NBT06-2]